MTGLAAAYELRDDAEVTIFEASDRLGGKVFTDELDGIQVEWGPDSLLARDEAPVQLLRELGLADEIVEPTDFGATIASNGKLKPLPRGAVLGIPTSPIALATSGLLSPAGVARAVADLFIPKKEIGDDISVGALIRRRFGDQVADRIVAPLMSGIRAGDIDSMSLEMAAPQIAAVARGHRSLALGLRRATRDATAPRFVGLRDGMSSLTTALRDAAGADVRLRSPVDTLENDTTVAGERFDGVVVALPPHLAAGVVGAPDLARIESSSVTVVNLVYPPGSALPSTPGTGVLVPPSSGRSLIACTWITKKWPHLAPADGRAVVRCVADGNASVETVVRELRDVVGVRTDPRSSNAHSWETALPRFEVGHRELIGGVQKELRGRPIRIAGAGFLATGLNDCLAHGRAAAREVLELGRT